jgi:hypothetical protein
MHTLADPGDLRLAHLTVPRRRPRPPKSKTDAAKLAERRLAGSLSALFDAAREGDVVAARGVKVEGPWSLLQASMFLRAINAVKVARLLIVELQWEFAAAPARQIFELVVTAEYIRAQADPRLFSIQFTRFGFLRQMLARLEEMDYEEQTGRPVNEEARTNLRKLLADFDDLRVGKNRDRWPRSSGGCPVFWPGGARRGGGVSLVCGSCTEREKASVESGRPGLRVSTTGGERERANGRNRRH